MHAVTTGRRRDRKVSARVSAPVSAALERGLSVRPDDRWPSMAALLRELEPEGSSSRWWMVPTAATAIAGFGLLAWANDGAPADRCEDVAQRLAGVWDQEARAQLATTIAGSGRAYATETWSKLEPAFDAYAGAWLDLRRDVCRSTTQAVSDSTTVASCVSRSAAPIYASWSKR
jgi:hypothetical protein